MDAGWLFGRSGGTRTARVGSSTATAAALLLIATPSSSPSPLSTAAIASWPRGSGSRWDGDSMTGKRAGSLVTDLYSVPCPERLEPKHPHGEAGDDDDLRGRARIEVGLSRRRAKLGVREG